MAKIVNGNMVGNVGNLNYYMSGGIPIVRKKRGKNRHPAQDKQLAGCIRLKLATQFVSRIREFITISFASAGKLKETTAYNAAMSELLNHAIAGEYPTQELDMTKVLVAKGNLRPPVNPMVTHLDSQLIFTWDVLDFSWPAANERAMLLAYVPELNESVFNLAGVKRSTGTDFLNLDIDWKGKKIETYIAFRAETGNMVSNSIYIGSIIF